MLFRSVGSTIVVENGIHGRCVPADPETVVTITVVDSARSAATTEITIRDVVGGACPLVEFALQPSSVTLSSAVTTAAVQILGGTAPFVVASSNPAVVTGGIVGRVLTLNRGIATGITVVTVTDSTSGTPRSLTVTVTNNP